MEPKEDTFGYDSSGSIYFIEDKDIQKVIRLAENGDKGSIEQLVNHYTFSFSGDAEADQLRVIWLKRAADLKLRGHTVDYLSILLRDESTSCEDLFQYLDQVAASNPEDVSELSKHPRIKKCKLNEG